MQIIKKLSGMIKEEIQDAEKYARCALNHKESDKVLAQQIMALDAKLASCCCEIKTQMLQNRYEDERAANVALRNDISNFQQSQYILGQTGRWVAWSGSGSQTTPAGT